MAKVIREYQIRPMVCGWALDIPMGNTTFVLHFNSRNNAELVKAILEWEDSHPNEAIPYQPTLTPPNEPEYREYTCPYCYHTWLEDRDASDYPNYCPVCRAVLRDGSAPPNDALTLEQLREMDGEPVWVTPLGFWALVISKRGQRVQLMCSDGETVWADKEIALVGPVYRRPPEGEEVT